MSSRQGLEPNALSVVTHFLCGSIGCKVRFPFNGGYRLTQVGDRMPPTYCRFTHQVVFSDRVT